MGPRLQLACCKSNRCITLYELCRLTATDPPAPPAPHSRPATMTELAVNIERLASIISRQMREAEELREELRQERAAAAAADKRCESAEARAAEAEAALLLLRRELANVRRELAEARRWAAAASELSLLAERQAAAAGRMAQHAVGDNLRSVDATDAFANGDARGKRTPAAGGPPGVQGGTSLCSVRARPPDLGAPASRACAAPACLHVTSSLPACAIQPPCMSMTTSSGCGAWGPRDHMSWRKPHVLPQPLRVSTPSKCFTCAYRPATGQARVPWRGKLLSANALRRTQACQVDLFQQLWHIRQSRHARHACCLWVMI
jgi:hypothetical protein